MSKELENLKIRLVKMIQDRAEEIVRTRDIDSLQRLYHNESHFTDMIKAARDDFGCIFALAERLTESRNLTKKECTLISVFLYLLTAEGMVCNDLNYIAYVLIITGHDLFSLTKRRYVKDNMEEIKKVEMSTKIQFLKHHGFGVLTKEYDSTLRNDIAHHNYRVDEDGNLMVRGKAIDLSPRIRSMRRIINFTTEAIQESTKGWDVLIRKMRRETTKKES